MSNLEPLMKQNFLEYASYVILDRAVPDLRDGCKPVQRRLLHTLFEMNDGHFHKVANVIGETMKLHPHGDASIGDALVVLANKEYFIDKQGNFGNVITGHRAAAPRYIECRLTPLALETLFNKNLTEFADSYDGRRPEPVVLPAKLPMVLLLGIEGIAVGLATKVLPHNLIELLKAQIKVIKKEKVKLYPDFLSGGIMDVSEYDDGRGKVRLRARIDQKGDKTLVIREIPHGTTTESLIASIETAAQKNRVKVSSIDDFTTDKVEIEVSLSRGCYAEEVIPQLYAYTDCEVSLNSNIVVIDNRHPVELTVTELLDRLTKQLREQIKAELEWELQQLEDRQHWLTLEQLFVENRVYKKIETIKTADGVNKAVWTGMEKFKKQFVRSMTDDDVKRLLDLRIRRISAYDIEKNRKDLDELIAQMKSLRSKLKNLSKTCVAYLDDLIKRYGEQYKRQTKVATFESVDKKDVARQDIKINYDAKTGFIGSQVRGADRQITVSEYDRILAISSDGSYRIMAPMEKKLLPGKLLYCELFNLEEGLTFTVVYRDKDKIAYGKKVQVLKFIKDKEYQLIKGDKGKVDLLILEGEPLGTIHLGFVPAKRQRVKSAQFDLEELELTGVAARGIRLAPKPVSKVKVLKAT
jgi:topoisomerase-4 subunit A